MIRSVKGLVKKTILVVFSERTSTKIIQHPVWTPFFWFRVKMRRFVQWVEFIRVKTSGSGSTLGLLQEIKKRVTEESVDFIMKEMPEAVFFDNRHSLLEYALSRKSEGLIAEFGVDRGVSINYLANLTREEIHGFDSFEGLPEVWKGHSDYSKRFRNQGIAPYVRKNVTLHVGWFEDSLPKFLELYQEDFGFIHIDSDIYVSSKIIFEQCRLRIKPGTIIVFDEYMNYPGWRNNEYKAFHEYVKGSNVKFKYFAYSGHSVGISIIG